MFPSPRGRQLSLSQKVSSCQREEWKHVRRDPSVPGEHPVSESIFKEQQDKANMSADLETSDQGEPFYTEEANDQNVYDNSIKISEEKEIDFEEDGSFEI